VEVEYNLTSLENFPLTVTEKSEAVFKNLILPRSLTKQQTTIKIFIYLILITKAAMR
jgi:hypothetical protein